MSKYFKKYLPAELSEMYKKTYSDGEIVVGVQFLQQTELFPRVAGELSTSVIIIIRKKTET